MRPGAMQLTVTPNGASSIASLRRRGRVHRLLDRRTGQVEDAPVAGVLHPFRKSVGEPAHRGEIQIHRFLPDVLVVRALERP
jgi:hypothetical protein